MIQNTRRYDIDWLRVFAMFGIFLLHATHLFDLDTDWHLRNVDQSMIVLVFRGLIDIWAVPLFFVLSGFGAWYALRRRNARQFLVERIKRLFIPLYTVGLFLIVLPQVYFDAYTNGFRGGFWEAVASNFSNIRFTPTWPGLVSLFPGHLWFLQFLLLVSVAVLPLLLALRSEAGKRFVGVVAKWCRPRGGILLMVIPLAISRIALMGFIRGQFTWATFVFFILLFVAGYMIAADERFTEGIKRSGWIGLALGLLSFAAQGFFLMVLDYQMFDEPFSMIFVLYQLVVTIGIWGFIVFLMSLAAKHWNRPGKGLSYANEAVLPFFLFHQTVILSVGWFVVQWNMHLAWKLGIVICSSFAITILLYELLVRRFNAVRFLFGMRPKK